MYSQRVAAAVILIFSTLTSAEDSSEWGLVTGKATTNCSCGYTNKESGRIVGGRDTNTNEYPLIAGLAYCSDPSYIFCGGTVITDRHVLTAAHCEPPGHAYRMCVVLAEHDTESTTESKTTVIPVKKMINHEKYDLEGYTENDLAILVLQSKIPFGKTIGPACFPKAGLNVVGSKVRVIGWGALYFNGPQPNTLQKVDLDVRPLSECSKYYGDDITPGQLCTYTLTKDACQGDSGGPVIWRDPATNRYTIVGVVSFGEGCASPGAPGVNTNVEHYRDWILHTISKTVPGSATCQNK